MMKGLKPPVSSEREPKNSKRQRLGSWKEIANYLGRTVRTVQRWEEKEGLPVRRLVHESGATVFAWQHEIDRWLNRRSLVVHDAVDGRDNPPSTTSTAEPAPGTGQSRPWLWPVVALFVVLASLALLWSSPWSDPPATITSPAPAPTAPEFLTTDSGVERYPALSPDGRSVAYTWDGNHDQADLYVRLVGTDGALRLTDTPTIEESPAWSPDGNFIVYLKRTATNRRELLMLPALGGVARSLGEFEVSESLDAARTRYASVDWSPDGSTLAITEGSDVPFRHWITLVDIETGQRTPLTDPPTGVFDMAPAFSPDGKRLAFARSSGPIAGGLQVIDLASTQSEPLALPMASPWNTEPAWTPDGQELVFASGYWPRIGLWRTASDGMGEPKMLFGPGEGGSEPTVRALPGGPGWRVVFSRNAMENDVWATDLATGQSRRLFGSSQRERYPTTMPDGRTAFISDRSGNREVWMVDANGENPQQWTNHKSTYILYHSMSSATGTLAYVVVRDGQLQAHLQDGPLMQSRPVFNDKANDYNLVWSANGERLYVASRDRGTGRPGVWVVDQGQSTPTAFAEGTYLLLGEDPDGEWLFMASQDGPKEYLLRASTSDGEITPINLGEGHNHSLTVGPDGVYFLAETETFPQIRRWRWQDGSIETLQQLDAKPEHGLAISRDGSQALMARLVLQRADLMMATVAENPAAE